MEDVARDSRQGLNETLFMLAPEELSSAQSALGRARLRTFITLRWLAVAGQLAAVLFVHFGLGFALPLGYCLTAIAASAWLNVFLSFALPSQRLARPWEATLQLVFDIVQLAVLIALTGGLANPFLLLMVAPVTVAALTLRPLRAVALAVLTLALASAMAVVSYPLPWTNGPADIPDLFKLGQLIALAVGVGFFAISAFRISQDEARLVRALDAASVVMAREQRLSALGAMSAMTAHELGTPLATIHLVARELANTLGDDGESGEDARLIAEQAERCRTILRQLAQRREASDIIHARMPVGALVEEAASPHKGLGVAVRVSYEPGAGGETRAPMLRRSPEILHALSAFIENAVSFAESEVRAVATWTSSQIIVTISDDGPGFAPEVLPKLGEPYVSHRDEAKLEGGDMGLGFFIAKTLIERTGGRVATRNRTPPKTGAVVQALWPREKLEAAADDII